MSLNGFSVPSGTEMSSICGFVKLNEMGPSSCLVTSIAWKLLDAGRHFLSTKKRKNPKLPLTFAWTDLSAEAPSFCRTTCLRRSLRRRRPGLRLGTRSPPAAPSSSRSAWWRPRTPPRTRCPRPRKELNVDLQYLWNLLSYLFEVFIGQGTVTFI